MAIEKVGPGRPPRKNMFKPGQSGNLQGRPPRSRNFATILFNQLNEKVHIDGRKITRFELMLRAQVDAAVIGNSRAVRQIVELWLSYHSDRPDRVDYHFEQQVMVGTHRKLNELYAVQCAEDEKRRRKEMKSAQRKKSRAERARKKKRAEAEAARMAATEAAELAAWKAARAAAAHTAGSATNVVVGSPPAGSR